MSAASHPTTTFTTTIHVLMSSLRKSGATLTEQRGPTEASR